MARFSDDDFAALQADRDRDAARTLGPLRRAAGEQQNAETQAWLSAGDVLAEKAVAALDSGEDERAARLVQRIVDLPEVGGEVRAGLMAVSLLLYGEVLDPTFEDQAEPGLLDAPLRLLPTLDAPVAAELRRVLAALSGSGLPTAVVQRIRTVVPAELRLDAPFAGVPEAELPGAVAGVLRLVLRLRGAED